MITVVLADDHAIFREGLATLLSFQPDIKVVGQAGDGNAALELIKTVEPDLAVIDISMPEKDGIEVAKEAKGLKTAFIILTMHGDAFRASQALENGARGYLLKEGAFDELVKAIREVEKGGRFISPPVLRELEAAKNDPAKEGEPGKGGLTLSLHPVLSNVREWVSQNLSSNFTLPDAAKASGTSVSHLSRLYKEQLGISFTDDVNRMRVEKAKWLLINTEDSVDAVWKEVGYETHQHFFRQFKKFTGKTPREYRLSMKDL